MRMLVPESLLNVNYQIVGFTGTIAKGAALLHQEGAREVYACSTHAVFRYVMLGSSLSVFWTFLKSLNWLMLLEQL